MGAITTLKQNNKPWTLTWKASGRYPIVADRIFETLADAQAYVDDKSATASATGGLIISVIKDSVAKNNGVYYIQSVANTDSKYGPLLDKGTLVKVGGADIESAANYTAAVSLSATLVSGQLINVAAEETVKETVNGVETDVTYKAGWYIVNSPGSISALDTSTGSSDEIGALNTRVSALEGNRVLNSDFNTYKSEISGALDAKAGLDDFNTHKNNANIHVTSEDKAKWNNAQANAEATAANALAAAKLELQGYADQAEADALSAAKSYADGLVKDADGNVKFDSVGSAAAAESAAKAHADGLVKNADGSVKFDSVGSAAAAESAAKAHADGLVKNADGSVKFDSVGSAAAAESAAKAHADSQDVIYDGKAQGYASAAESAAKAHADSQDVIYDGKAQGYATTAEGNAKSYTDTVVGSLPVNGETTLTVAQAIEAAETAAKSYADGLDDEMDKRVKVLEAIDHDKLAADASADAVAKIVASAPEDFDTLKEVADWIANDKEGAAAIQATTAANKAAIEVLNGNAETEGSVAKAVADGVAGEAALRVAADEALGKRIDDLTNGAVKNNTDAIAVLNGDAQTTGSVAKAAEDAKAAAIAKAAEDAAKMLEDYYTKEETDAAIKVVSDDVDALEKTVSDLDAAYKQADIDLKAALEQYADDAQAQALADAKSHVAELIASYYTKAEVDEQVAAINKTIGDNKKAAEDALADLDTRVSANADAIATKADATATSEALAKKADKETTYTKTEVDNLLSGNSTTDQTYAKEYTDALFNSITFVSKDQIDGLFE